jgi:membrane protein implicated in regulation of membrane protease activity
MKGMQGWLWLVYGLVLLPIGFIIMGIGLYRTAMLPRWQAALLIAGSALLLNPDIEIISVAASCLLAIALVPLGVQRIRKALPASQV